MKPVLTIDLLIPLVHMWNIDSKTILLIIMRLPLAVVLKASTSRKKALKLT